MLQRRGTFGYLFQPPCRLSFPLPAQVHFGECGCWKEGVGEAKASLNRRREAQVPSHRPFSRKALLGAPHPLPILTLPRAAASAGRGVSHLRLPGLSERLGQLCVSCHPETGTQPEPLPHAGGRAAEQMRAGPASQKSARGGSQGYQQLSGVALETKAGRSRA